MAVRAEMHRGENDKASRTKASSIIKPLLQAQPFVDDPEQPAG
jgi:hypothetical protein